MTYHGNHFYNVNSRVPSLRFVRSALSLSRRRVELTLCRVSQGTGHVFNNYYENVKGSGINAREGAEVLVESNYFKVGGLSPPPSSLTSRTQLIL